MVWFGEIIWEIFENETLRNVEVAHCLKYGISLEAARKTEKMSQKKTTPGWSGKETGKAHAEMTNGAWSPGKTIR